MTPRPVTTPMTQEVQLLGSLTGMANVQYIPGSTGINDSFVYCIHAGVIVLFRKVANQPDSLCVPTSLACVLHIFTFGRNFVL